MAIARLFLVLSIGLFACADPEPPPPAPLNNRSPGNFGNSVGARRDSGPAIDAPGFDGAIDASSMSGCIPIAEGDAINRALVRRGSEDIAFPVLSAAAFYNEVPCSSESRELIFALYSNPTCDLRIAPYLVVLIDAQDIGAVIPVGAPLSVTFSPALEVYFVQPGSPSSIAFQNCLDSDATINFTSLETVSGEETFELSGTLINCVSGDSVFIDASFSVPLEQPFESACL
ncbi:MAG: hypothetical protein ACI9KE_006064 [Polyangiales bacterium]|jgi:hypothetical protein